MFPTARFLLRQSKGSLVTNRKFRSGARRGWIVFVLTLTACVPSSTSESQAVDALFSQWDTPDSPGLAVAVIRDGRVIHKRGYGSANLDYNVPITSKTVFYMASVSKQFTAMAARLLEEEGLVSLDDDLRQYFPEIPDYGSTITLRHLIHHTSGLRDYLGLWRLKGRNFADSMEEEEIIALIARQQGLNFTPGDKHLYCNSGYFLLAELVKRVTEKTIRQYTEETIFNSLGMDATHFHDDRNMVVKNRAESYRADIDAGFQLVNTSFDLVGSGGLYSTLDDMIKWDANLDNNSIGSGEPLMKGMLKRGVLNSGEELDYAYGLVHGEYRGLKTLGHGGSMFGYRTFLLRFPEEQFSVILLANIPMNSGNLARKVAEIYLEGVMESESSEGGYHSELIYVVLSSEVLTNYEGLYREESGPVIEVSVRGDSLRVKRTGGNWRPLVPLDETTFRTTDGGARYKFLVGKTSGDTLKVYAGDDEWTLPEITGSRPSERELAGFVGDYFSEELDATYRLRLSKEELTVTVHYGEPRVLHFGGKDRFVIEDVGDADFRRSREGRISGFTLNAGRVTGLQFKRR